MQTKIQVGMRVLLFIPQKSEGNVKGSFALSSTVEDLPNDEDILIQAPMHKGYYYPLPHEPVLMRFIHESKHYSLQVQLQERIQREDFMLARMKRCSAVERHQMRDNFRLDVKYPVKVLRRLSAKSQYDTRFCEGIACDLSENGMLLSIGEELSLGETITVTIDIDGEVTLDAHVLRIEKVEHPQFQYKAGLVFQHEDRTVPDRIFKYILKTQTRRRRNGKG